MSLPCRAFLFFTLPGYDNPIIKIIKKEEWACLELVVPQDGLLQAPGPRAVHHDDAERQIRVVAASLHQLSNCHIVPPHGYCYAFALLFRLLLFNNFSFPGLFPVDAATPAT